MTRMIAIVAAVSLSLLLVATYFLTMGRSGDRFAQCRASAVAGGNDAFGGSFTLVDEDGRTVTDAEVLNEPALVYFGYTYCPDICPLDTARNAQAVTLLDDRGETVTPVFITIDPARDTPEQLKEFTDMLHPRLVGLTGTEAQIQTASQAFRTYYRKAASDDPAFYLMDHSTFTYLTLPGEGFVEYFRRDLGAQDLADRVQCFLDAA